MSNTFSTLFRSSAHKSRLTHRDSRSGRAYLPKMEALEDRVVLSTMSVVNLLDSGPGSLRQAIDDANASVGVPDVIDFASGLRGTIELTSGELEITDELTINGPGKQSLTISGNHLSRVFHVESTASINGVTIADGLVLGEGSGYGSSLPGGMGGGVFVATAGQLSLDRVALRDNHVNGNLSADGAGRGGGIYVDGGGSLTVTHSSFIGNQATGNRAGAGGAIFAVGAATLSVGHSDFADNGARTNSLDESGGFGAFCNNPVPGLACSFSGGAIQYDGSGATIDQTRFTDNYTRSVGEDNTLAGGGALSGGFDVSKSRFEGNSVEAGYNASGGAITSAFFQFTSVTDTTFIDNSVRADMQAFGGAISAAYAPFDALQISDSRFIKNSTTGGALAQGGAISLNVNSEAHITGSQFVGNAASSDVLALGGAIANTRGSILTVDQSSIVNNEVISAGDALGGGIYNDGVFNVLFGFLPGTSNVTLTRTNVNANRATGGNGVGGGVYDAGNEDVETLFVDDLTNIHGNKASTSDDDVFGDLTFLDELLALV